MLVLKEIQTLMINETEWNNSNTALITISKICSPLKFKLKHYPHCGNMESRSLLEVSSLLSDEMYRQEP